jgi:hypothetical protein
MNARHLIAGLALAAAAVGSAQAAVFSPPTFTSVSDTVSAAGAKFDINGNYTTGDFNLAPAGFTTFTLQVTASEYSSVSPVEASVFFNGSLLTSGVASQSSDGSVYSLDFSSLTAGLYRVDVTGTSNSKVYVEYQAAAAVPEPESLALLLAGMGVVGFSLSRRKV